MIGRLASRIRHPGPGPALYVLSPVIAELCLGATPPISFLFFGWALLLLYGGGAILIRETTLRWGKGWPTVLALGAAYGIFEEGIVVRTLLDPTVPVFHELGDYGRALGVNWLPTVLLALYHSVVSIAIPIGLVVMAYPGQARQPWVGQRGLFLAILGLAAITAVWLLSYKVAGVEWPQLVGAAAAIVGFVALGRLLPATLPIPAGRGRAPSPERVMAVTILAVVGVFAVVVGRGFGLPVLAAMAVMVAFAGAAAVWVAAGSRRPGWTDRQRFAIAAGVLTLMSFWSMVLLIGVFGQALVGLATLIVTIAVWRRLRARERAQSSSDASSWEASSASDASPSTSNPIEASIPLEWGIAPESSPSSTSGGSSSG